MCGLREKASVGLNDGEEESGCGTENFYTVLTKLTMGVTTRKSSATGHVPVHSCAVGPQGATCVVSRALRGEEPWVANCDMFLSRPTLQGTSPREWEW